MKFVLILHIFRVALPILFIKLISYLSDQELVQVWLEFLLIQQLGLLITESGVSLSGPLLLKKLDNSRKIIQSALLLQLSFGLLGLCITYFVFAFSEGGYYAYLVGMIQGLSLTWLLRYNSHFYRWFLYESSYRIIIHVVGGLFFWFYRDLQIVLSFILAVSMLWFLYQYLNLFNGFNYNRIQDRKSFFTIYFQGIGIKTGALLVYPGLLLYGKDFFDYSTFHILQMDKIAQSIRGLYTPIIEFLFPKSVRNKTNISSKRNVFMGLSIILSISLFIVYPMAFNIIFGRGFILNFNVRVIMSLIPFLYGLIHFHGTFGLLLNSRIKFYLLSFLFSVTLGIWSLKSGSVIIYLITPHLSLFFFTMLFNNYFIIIDNKVNFSK